MSSSELSEHAGYFKDLRKLTAYNQAIHDIVREGDVVVDLGAGTGLLGLIAAEAGASTIYMIDAGPVLAVAEQVAAANGFGDRIVPVREMSTSADLPELADVIVCDQIGGMVYDARVLEYFADARERLLKPGGAFVPSSFALSFGPVSAPEARAEVDIWLEQTSGFDTRSVHTLATNTEWHIGGSAASLVAGSASLGKVDSWSQDALKATEVFSCDDKATVDGWLGWFDAELAPSVHLTNHPADPDRMQRWCNFYPFTRALDVLPGDELSITVDLRPEPGIVSWTTVWMRDGAKLETFRQSTLLGQFLGPEDLPHLAASGRPARLKPRGAAVAAALAAVDGTASISEVVDAVLVDHPDAFPSQRRAREVLEREIGRWAVAES